MTSVAEFTAKCDRIATTMPRVNRVSMVEAAHAAEVVLTAQWAADGVVLGKPLSGFLPRHVPIGVLSKVTGEADATALVAMTGPALMLDVGQREHVIGAKGLATRAGHRRRGKKGLIGQVNVGAYSGLKERSGGKALHFGSSFYAHVLHPAVPGKRSFDKAVPVITRTTPAVIAKGWNTALRKEFV